MEPEEKDVEELTAIGMVGIALSGEVERYESGTLSGDQLSDCVDNIVKLAKVITDDDKRASQMYTSEREQAIQEARLALEQQKLEDEKKRQKVNTTLRCVEIGVGIASFGASMWFTNLYFTRMALYETTGATRSNFGRAALKLCEPFQRKMAKAANEI